ncbi:hypothetical protein ES703_24240 [subsurface metagenome]
MCSIKKRTLKTFTNFGIFVNRFYDKIYGMHIFAELADNGLLGCTLVVGVKS